MSDGKTVQLTIRTGPVLFDPLKCEWMIPLCVEDGPITLVDVTQEMSRIVSVMYETDGTIVMKAVVR